METLYFWRSKALGCVLAFLLLASCPVAFAAGVSAKPFPRIETEQHTARIKRIGVDAQTRFIVTGSNDKTARIWDFQTGDLLRVLRPPIGAGHEGKLYSAAISPEGNTVAVGGWTGYEWDRTNSIYIFSRDSGELTHRIDELPNVINHLAFSMDGKRLAAALGGTNGIRVYRTDKWKAISRDTDYGNRSQWVAFGQSGRLVSASLDGFIRLYNSKLKLIAKEKAPGGNRPLGVAFSPDGSLIAVGFDDSTAVNVLSGDDLSFLYAPNTSEVNKGSLSKVAWSRDGEVLYAGGRYRSQGQCKLVMWSQKGRGQARQKGISTNTITNLISIADGRLIFGAADPAWGILDAAGNPLRGRGPGIADFRNRRNEFHLSDEGTVAQVAAGVLNANMNRQAHTLRLDLKNRQLSLDPEGETEQLQRQLLALGFRPGAVDGKMGRKTHKALKSFQRRRGLAETGDLDAATREALGLPVLAKPKTETPGFQVTDWNNNYKPKLNGEPLPLKEHEFSRTLDIASDDRRFLLGTDWYLRLFNKNGDQIWRKPTPSATWMVNLSEDGRWAVACFGDGSIRWYDTSDGSERLALFVDGAAILKGQSPIPWVLWTPEGFFDAGGGGERLMGWHMNRDDDQASEFLKAEQIGEVFRRPDLVARALEDDYPQLAQNALKKMGDLKQLLAKNKPPQIERIGPETIRQDSRVFNARFRIKNRGGGVGRIEYKVNGTVVGQAEIKGRFGLVIGNQVEETRSFTFGAGMQRIEARAFDESNQLASQPAVWKLEIMGDERRPALYGLAVGVRAYKNQQFDLKYADADAQEFVAELRKVAGSLFKEVDLTPLVNDEATLANITATFETIAARTGPEDVFVLFLAGHGLAVDGRYHFIPHELIYKNRKDLEQGSLNEDRLRDLLAKVKAHKSLVILDSCYAGAAIDGNVLYADLTRGQPLEERAAVDRLMATTGRAILASATDRQFALEGLDGHGVFTHALLEGLRGEADRLGGDRDRTVTISELANYLDHRVPIITLQKWQYEQFPMMDLRGQSFPIGRYE